MKRVLKIALLDLIRNKWIWAYAVFYALLAVGLLRLGDQPEKALISLLNISLLLVPLVSLIFSLMYLYQLRDYLELLLSQPVSRKAVFTGYYLGINLVLSLALIAGLVLPSLILGAWEPLGGWLTLFAVSLFHSWCFAALGMALALKFENRLKGFGLALFLWLFFGILYDGLLMYILLLFQEYPLESVSLAGGLLNPLDMGRLLVIFQLDHSALLGYTGAVFRRFFGSSTGTWLLAEAAALWIFLPYFWYRRTGIRRDF